VVLCCVVNTPVYTTNISLPIPTYIKTFIISVSHQWPVPQYSNTSRVEENYILILLTIIYSSIRPKKSSPWCLSVIKPLLPSHWLLLLSLLYCCTWSWKWFPFSIFIILCPIVPISIIVSIGSVAVLAVIMLYEIPSFFFYLINVNYYFIRKQLD